MLHWQGRWQCCRTVLLHSVVSSVRLVCKLSISMPTGAHTLMLGQPSRYTSSHFARFRAWDIHYKDASRGHLVQASIVHKLHYCDSILAGISRNLLNHFQSSWYRCTPQVPSLKWDWITPLVDELHGLEILWGSLLALQTDLPVPAQYCTTAPHQVIPTAADVNGWHICCANYDTGYTCNTSVEAQQLCISTGRCTRLEQITTCCQFFSAYVRAEIMC